MKIQVSLIKKGTLEKIEGTKLWKVATPYIWEIKNGNTTIVKVDDFVTDFGSIPRILWSVFNPTEFNSYILHDYLYKYSFITSRSKADTALQIGLLSEGSRAFSALVIYSTVRLFGWIYFKNKYKYVNGHK